MRKAFRSARIERIFQSDGLTIDLGVAREVDREGILAVLNYTAFHEPGSITFGVNSKKFIEYLERFYEHEEICRWENMEDVYIRIYF